MNGLTIAVICAALLALGTPVLAQTDEDAHAGHHPAPEARADAPAQPLAKGFERMRSLIAQAQAEQDPAARRRLLGEHAQAMRDQVRAMRAATRPGERAVHDHAAAEARSPDSATERKRRGPMGDGGMMRGKGGMMGMHQRVEQRLDAIEQMLEQLVEREALEQ